MWPACCPYHLIIAVLLSVGIYVFITLPSSVVCLSKNSNVTTLLMGTMIIDHTTFPTDMCWKESKYAQVLEQQPNALAVYIFLLTEYFSRDCGQ